MSRRVGYGRCQVGLEGARIGRWNSIRRQCCYKETQLVVVLLVGTSCVKETRTRWKSKVRKTSLARPILPLLLLVAFIGRPRRTTPDASIHRSRRTSPASQLADRGN